MAKGIYSMDPSGLRSIGQSAEMGKAMVAAAQQGLEWAEQSAPRDTEQFAQNFEIVQTDVKKGRKGEVRSGAAIRNNKPYAAFVHKKGETNFMNQIVAHVEEVNK